MSFGVEYPLYTHFSRRYLRRDFATTRIKLTEADGAFAGGPGEDGWSEEEEPIAPNESFMEAVFAFVFGRGDPNGSLETRRRRALALLLRANHGAVYAEQVRRRPMYGSGQHPLTHSLAVLLIKHGWAPLVPCLRARERAKHRHWKSWLSTDVFLDFPTAFRRTFSLGFTCEGSMFDEDYHVYPETTTRTSRPHAMLSSARSPVGSYIFDEEPHTRIQHSA